jgi:hypothetical protein
MYQEELEFAFGFVSFKLNGSFFKLALLELILQFTLQKKRALTVFIDNSAVEFSKTPSSIDSSYVTLDKYVSSPGIAFISCKTRVLM